MLLLSTSSLTGYGLHRIFTFAQKTGYIWLDIALWILNYDLWDEEYILKLSQEFTVPVLSLTAPWKDMSQEKLKKIMHMAEVLGVQLVTFSPPHITDKDTSWFGESLKNYKKHTHISVCIQNVESKFLFFVIPEYRGATFEKIKNITGDTTLDIVAIENASNMDVMKAQAVLGSSIKNVLFSDKNSTQKWILPGSSGGWLSTLPLESFLMKLKSGGYTGFITLKVSAKELGVGNSERVLQNLEYMKKYYEKHFEHFIVS
jgi:sugar phosphate isomerase/epimerase